MHLNVSKELSTHFLESGDTRNFFLLHGEEFIAFDIYSSGF